MTLVIVSAVLAIVSYGLKELAKERVKDLGDGVQSAESQYLTEQRQSIVSLRLWQDELNQQIREIREAQAVHPDKQTVDYTDVIRTNLTQLQSIFGDLDMDYGSVSRLLDSLPRHGGALRKQLEQLRPGIDEIKQRVDETAKPSPKHDWTRLVEIKLMIARVAITETPVLLVGDAALTGAHKTREAAERLYHLLQWVCYGLFTMGVALRARNRSASGSKSCTSLTSAKPMGRHCQSCRQSLTVIVARICWADCCSLQNRTASSCASLIAAA